MALIQEQLGRRLSIGRGALGEAGTRKYKKIQRSKYIATIMYEIKSGKNLLYSMDHSLR
jgi:hypothetical protein